jgi:hypothetical protein
MAVVPTSTQVTLTYGATGLQTLGDVLTEITVLAGVTFVALRWKKRRRVQH